MATDYGKLEETLEAEECFGNLLESMPDAIVVASESGRIVLANCRAEDLFDYLPGEMRGMALEAVLPRGPEAWRGQVPGGRAQQPAGRRRQQAASPFRT
jgi:protein-histidine pros-kinase